MKRKMSFTASGDALILRHIPKDYPGFEQVSAFLRQGDARITNLEAVLTAEDCFPSSYSGGTWVKSHPSVLRDLQDFGFNLYGWANNHTMDYSYDGLFSTKRALEEAGLVHAGAGRNLYEASKPGILDLPGGRVGFINICSTFNMAARAGMQSAAQQGRPGLNPLRFSTLYTVTPEHMKALREIAAATKMNGRMDNKKRRGYESYEPEGTFDFGSMRFAEGETESRMTHVNKNDLERTVRTIQDTLRKTDYVVVMVHSHEVKGLTDEEPDYFLEEFARACIDAGACAVIGGGTHQLKAIELYRGKPIFYSLGNFIFQTSDVEVLPPDFMEKNKMPMDYTAAQAIATRSERAKAVSGGKPALETYRSVLPYFEFEEDTLKKLILQPIHLGYGYPHTFTQWPYPACGEDADWIYETLTRLSAPYGTAIRRQGELLEVELPRD